MISTEQTHQTAPVNAVKAQRIRSDIKNAQGDIDRLAGGIETSRAALAEEQKNLNDALTMVTLCRQRVRKLTSDYGNARDLHSSALGKLSLLQGQLDQVAGTRMGIG